MEVAWWRSGRRLVFVLLFDLLLQAIEHVGVDAEYFHEVELRRGSEGQTYRKCGREDSTKVGN